MYGDEGGGNTRTDTAEQPVPESVKLFDGVNLCQSYSSVVEGSREQEVINVAPAGSEKLVIERVMFSRQVAKVVTANTMVACS